MSECGDKAEDFSLMLLAEIGDVMEGVRSHSSWLRHQPLLLSPALLPNSSPRTPLLGSQWWWMGGGARAGHLSTPFPLPPLIRVIYPLWVSALSESLLPRDRQPRLQMTTGLAGGTHPSPEWISFYLPLYKLCQLFILFPEEGAVHDAARKPLEDI